MPLILILPTILVVKPRKGNDAQARAPPVNEVAELY
jgi:hypothetical protein